MPEFRGVQKLDLAPMLHELPGDKGFSMNLLANSLTSKLKLQRKACSPVKPGRGNGESVAVRVAKSILANREKRRPSRQTHRSDATKQTTAPSSRAGSATTTRRESQSGGLRVDSASSDRLPALPSSSRQQPGKASSRRSNSASPVTARGRRHVNSRTPSSHSDLSFVRNHQGSEMSGAFDVRGPGRSVMVVKRDGVFQPLDKYAPPRQMMRDVAPVGKRGACEYEFYDICDDSYGERTGTSKSQEDQRKSLKVSWSKTKMETKFDNEGDPEQTSPKMMSAPSSAPTPIRRALSVDNFAFRKPVYSSGKSRVASIGVKWMVPNVAKEDEKPPVKPLGSEAAEAPKEELVKKPMWSWLITPEAAKPPCPPKPRSRQSSNVSPVQHSSSQKQSSVSGAGTYSSSLQRLCRDVHPLSTAMNREGTSVSRTKWHVPGSTSSTLDNERAIYGRLELVKRPGDQLLYDFQSGAVRVVTTEATASGAVQEVSGQGKTRSKTMTRTINASEVREDDQRDVQSDIESTVTSSQAEHDGTLSPTKSHYT